MYLRKNHLLILLTLLAVWGALHTALITIDGLTDEMEPAEVAVILGNKVNEDGSLSPRLIGRVETGLQLYEDGLVEKLMVSGGYGKEKQYEGTKMAEYLMRRGVPEKALIIDDAGNNTMQTAVNYAKLELDMGSVIVVSQFHHISRTKLAFKKVGLGKVRGVHADFYEWRDFYSVFREIPAYYAYLIKQP